MFLQISTFQDSSLSKIGVSQNPEIPPCHHFGTNEIAPWSRPHRKSTSQPIVATSKTPMWWRFGWRKSVRNGQETSKFNMDIQYIYIYTKKKMWFKKVIPMEHDSCYDYSILRCLNALLCHVNQISAKNEISGALPPCASLLCFKAFHDRVSVSTKWSLQDLFQHNQLPCRRTKAPISPNATFLCLQKTYKNRLMFFYLATCYLEKKKRSTLLSKPPPSYHVAGTLRFLITASKS